MTTTLTNRHTPKMVGELVAKRNWRALTPQLSQEKRQELDAYRQKYGDWSNFFAKFGADRQTSFAEHPEGCYLGDAPCLVDIKHLYGKEQMRMWLASQLNHACMCLGKAFVGSDIPRNPILIEYVNSLCINYPGLKVTEWMLFLFRMRSGRYGKIYGDVTPDYCSEALKQFVAERNYDLDIYNRQLQQSQKPDHSDCVTYDEYLRMKVAGEI